MSKLVCIDNTNRFYLPVDYIISVKAGKTEDLEDPLPQEAIENKSFVDITYADGTPEYSYYRVWLRDTYYVDEYCKSLQIHVNLLK